MTIQIWNAFMTIYEFHLFNWGWVKTSHINHHNYDLWIDVPWCTPIIHNTYGWHIYKSSINPSYGLPMATIQVQTKRVPGVLPTRQRRPFAFTVSVVAIVAVVVATARGEAADGGGVDQTVPTWPWSARVFRDKNGPKMVSPPLKMGRKWGFWSAIWWGFSWWFDNLIQYRMVIQYIQQTRE